MNLKLLFKGRAIYEVSRFRWRLISAFPPVSDRGFATVTIANPLNFSPRCFDGNCVCDNGKPKPSLSVGRSIHTVGQSSLSGLGSNPKFVKEDSEEEDGAMNEFLSRFVWIMRGKLSEGFPDCDRQTIDGMLLVLVEKVMSEMEKGGSEQVLGSGVVNPSDDFSEDLWRTVWEVSNKVLVDMENERKKERMKGFLQCEEVKEMARFAGQVGIRGELLRELRFKWAREKMEESDFYESLERLIIGERAGVSEETAATDTTIGKDAVVAVEEKPEGVTLPKRHGKIKYKIYGLDLSSPKWSHVADKIHEAGEVIWPQEPKPISGKAKLVTDKILSMQEVDDPTPLLAEWTELLQPGRIDWINLLENLEGQNRDLYFKVAEYLLGENTFETNIYDYSNLINIYAKENRVQDAERILNRMIENGIQPGVLTATTLVHMYSRAGNLDRAKEAYETLKSHGFQPDLNVYESMIMAYVNANQPKLADSLMREMDTRNVTPTEKMYIALLRSFAQRGEADGAAGVATSMQFAGRQLGLEAISCLVEAYGKAGDPERARNNFDYLRQLGHKPDDRCTASMIAAYEKRNALDDALNLLLELEKDGFEPGPATYTVLIDWLGKLQLVDEAEQLLSKISEMGEAPPFQIHVSLCDMYARAGMEKKALQTLGILEAKKEQLSQEEFQRVIYGLLAGGFVQDARRINELMEAQGFTASKELKVALEAQRSPIYNKSKINRT